MTDTVNETIERPNEVERLYKHLLASEYCESLRGGILIYIGILDRKKDACMCRDKAAVYVKRNNEWDFAALMNADLTCWGKDEARALVYKIIKIQFPEMKRDYVSYKKRKKI